MPLNQPLADMQYELRALMAEDLFAALSQLEKLLPLRANKQADITALRGRLNDANRKKILNHISNDEYQREKDRVRSDFYDLVNSLEEIDFQEIGRQDGKKMPKTGTVLYRVPHRMLLQKRTRCVVRVAVEEGAIVENILLDEDVHLRHRLEVSEAMQAQILDPVGDNFIITSPNDPRQVVRDWGYTEWVFFVTPLYEGTYELIVKVSMLANVPDVGLVSREEILAETVQIVTEIPTTAEEEPLKSTGISFALPVVSTDDSTPPPVAVPPVSWINTATYRVGGLVVLSVLAVFALMLVRPHLNEWTMDWPFGGGTPRTPTRNATIIIHAPEDQVVEAFLLDGKNIFLSPLHPGIWAVSIKIAIDSTWHLVTFQGNVSGKTNWSGQITDPTHLYVPRLTQDTSCGLFVKVHTTVYPTEQWRLIWQKNLTETETFTVRPLSDTTFFVQLGQWCDRVYDPRISYDFRLENGDIRLSRTHVVLGNRPATLEFWLGTGPLPAQSNVNNSSIFPQTTLLFNRPILLTGIRINGVPVKQFTRPYAANKLTRQIETSFVIDSSNVGVLDSQAKKYAIEILSSDCTCQKKKVVVQPEIQTLIICKPIHISSPKPIKVLIPYVPPISLTLPKALKLGEHVQDLELTVNGHPYPKAIRITNDQISNLDLILTPDNCDICLWFLSGHSSGKMLNLGCYKGPIVASMQLRLIDGEIVRVNSH